MRAATREGSEPFLGRGLKVLGAEGVSAWVGAGPGLTPGSSSPLQVTLGPELLWNSGVGVKVYLLVYPVCSAGLW